MMKTMLLLLFFCILLAPVSIFASEQVVTIDTRQGVTMKLLLVSPETQTDKAMIMFPGASGYRHFSSDEGAISKGRNFLVRTSPDFARKGFLVAVVDSPSDRKGMDDNFRTSKEHLQDISKAVDYLTDKGYKSIYLIGTSMGTISAAYIGAELKNPAIKGVILTSTMSYSRYLRWISLDKTPYPVLIVHHKEDDCKAVNSYSEASRMTRVFKNSPKVDFVGVSGGQFPQSDPCESLSPHGYFGIENEVIDKIANWIFSSY